MDYRAITKFFNTELVPYHTYQLPSEKSLNVVLRGVPVEIHEKEIFEDLCERSFAPDSVIRMRRTRDKAPMPLVLVKWSKDQKSIYHLKEVLSLDITTETLKSRPSVGQCFRCQRFGHAQSRCMAPRKCVACAESHEAGECPRSKQTPATCANCGETHPANYRGCSRFPKPRPILKTPSRSNTASGNGRSYSQALAGSSHTRPRATSPKSPRVRFPSGKPTTPAKGKSNPSSANSEDAKADGLLDALQSVLAQIEKVAQAIKLTYPSKLKSRQQ